MGHRKKSRKKFKNESNQMTMAIQLWSNVAKEFYICEYLHWINRKFQIYNLTMYFKVLEKQEQSKSKTCRSRELLCSKLIWMNEN